MTVVKLQLKDAVGSRTAYEYLKRKISLCLIEPKSKKPTEKNWTTNFYTDKQDAERFVNHNIGFILGRNSGWLTDIDLDSDEAVALAPYLLPGTDWVFGRASNERSHYVYISHESKTAKFTSPLKEGGMLLEIRSDGAQTVAPGSIHPSGEGIHFYGRVWQQKNPETVTFSKLEQCCRDLAAASLILRHGWATGKRDEVCVALVGLLLRAGRKPEDVDHWIEAIARAAGDEELDMRSKAEYQQERIDKGEKVPGIPRLITLLGNEITSRVIEWLGVKGHNIVYEFNEEIAVIVMGDKSRILIDGGYWSDQEPKFMKVTEARLLYQSRGDVTIGKKQVPKFDVWLNSPERRTYSRIVFSPDGNRDFEYNLWKGWPINQINKPAGCKRFLQHVKDNICSGDEELYDYVIHWLADAVQNPAGKPGIALVLQGKQGTGKTAFGEYVLAMYGKYGLVSTNQDHLFGKHNFHLANKLMVMADESCWAGNRHHAAILHNYITGSSLSYEPKGIDALTIDNFMRLMMITNDRWAVPASGDARRFCVIKVGDKVRNDHKYFEALYEEMINDGAECLLGYLRSFKRTRNLRILPQTGALLQNKLLTMTEHEPVKHWWMKRLVSGTQMSNGEEWMLKVPKDELQRDFINSAMTSKIKLDRSAQVSFGILFKECIPPNTKTIQRSTNGRVKRYFEFPSLEKCREYFANEVMNDPKFFDKNLDL